MADTPTANVVVGTPVTLTTQFTIDGVLSAATGAVSCVVVNPVGAEHTYTGEITNPSTGIYRFSVLTDMAGLWHWRWVIDGQATDEGEFTAETDFSGVADPTVAAPDLTSLRVLVPRARRVCEGPYGPPQNKPVLLDSQLYAMVADACADMILFTGSLFGHQLLVAQRDPLAGFPTEWKTEKLLDEWEGALITTQAALNHFMFILRDLRQSESISNEGTTWDYELSASVLTGYLKELQMRRDMAIEGLRQHHPVIDRFASNIRVRDQATVAVLEWWAHDAGSGGGLGIPGGQEAYTLPWVPGWFPGGGG